MLRLLKFPRVFSFSIFLGIEMSRIQQNLHYLEILIGATVMSVVSVLLMELSLNLFDFRI